MKDLKKNETKQGYSKGKKNLNKIKLVKYGFTQIESNCIESRIQRKLQF